VRQGGHQIFRFDGGLDRDGALGGNQGLQLYYKGCTCLVVPQRVDKVLEFRN
jgi:hypothetical protein